MLVEWCSLLVQKLAGSAQWESLGSDILVSMAEAIDRCMQAPVKHGIVRSTLTVSRRAFRKLFATQELCVKNMKSAIVTLTSKQPQPILGHAPILGIVAGVAARIPYAHKLLLAERSHYYDFFAREVVGSRTPVAPHIATSLKDFFNSFTSMEDLVGQIIPPLEKALLRAPEVVLDGVLQALVDGLPEDQDLSAILQKNFMKPIMASVKSSNVAIRNGALTAFRGLATRSRETSITDKLLDELTVPLKAGKVASPEQRILFAEMIELTPTSNAADQTAIAAVAAAAAKEGNESALATETRSLSSRICGILSRDGEVPKSILDIILKGLGDKKAPMRRLWLLSVGDILLTSCQHPTSLSAQATVDALSPKLLDALSDIKANIPGAVQNNLMAASFIAVALEAAITASFPDSVFAKQSVNNSIVKQAFQTGNQSFLLNNRVYGKITQAEDLRWLCLAMECLANELTSDPDSAANIEWAQLVIHLIISSTVPPSVRQQMANILSDLYLTHTEVISTVVIEGIWDIVATENAKDGRFEVESIVKILHLLCKGNKASIGVDTSPPKQIQKQMCALIVLARPELVPQANWIDLCLHVGIDPGQLAKDHTKELMDEIGIRTSPHQPDCIKLAAYKAAADLAFVAPGSILPPLLVRIQNDLDSAQLDNIGPVEAAITRSPQDVCFIDVLAKKTLAALPTKSSEDMDLEVWEMEMHASAEERKKAQKKLSADESAKLNAQLKKEAAIRESVETVRAKMLRSFGIVQALAAGPPTDPTLWLGSAVRWLLAAIDAGASLVIGTAAADAFMACSDRVSSRLGAMRPFIGAAILRLRKVSVAQNLQEEALEDLITRALYRLRFAAEQRPFDVASLMYIIPLLVYILQTGGVGNELDERDAQLVLAIEILSFHTAVCEDESLPRADLLSILVETMQNHAQHYKICRDCFADLSRCIAPNISQAEMEVLAAGVIVPQSNVRATILQSISADIDLRELQCSDQIWIASHDNDLENRDLGLEIWDESEFRVTPETPIRLVQYLKSKDAQLRQSTARSLADALRLQPGSTGEVLAELQSLYTSLAKPKLPQVDEYGMTKKADLSDPWEARMGVGSGFKELVVGLTTAQLDSIFTFWMESGPFADRDSKVRAEMLDAALQAIEHHGKAMLGKLMRKFELVLETGDKNTDAADRLNEAVIITYGALASHLPVKDPKTPVVVDQLLATLSTPSETVQFAISECLPPLIKAIPDKASKYFQKIMDDLLNAESYAAQRGAAYGLAGMVRGRGISALREFRILSALKGAIEDKKSASKREGALMGLELLSTVLGRVFEPYVLQIVPQLLSGFGDSNADVRDACLAAAKACFGKLSSYGVKQIMPTLLSGLDDQQWRSKRGACDLLGAMAYLDPNQLANSLPDIIPPLTGVLNDSHKEVRAAANRSLKRFGEVITNPEIKSLVDMLLKALSDPTKYTEEALDALIKVQFVHYLDAPSLALVTRILQRGLNDRSNTKRKAAQVIGSLAHLTEKKDIVIHLPILVAGLKIAAVDPVPTTRATASRALGSLVEKLGEDALPDLIPGLMQTLKSDTGAGDRLGSAQALSEVLAGLGTARLEETLPTILQNVESSKSAVREGFMSLFIFLPVCFGNSFANYLGRIVPPILAGLADDVESIRETALRAGRLLVKNFAVRAVDLLLPELERGLADDSYRIRLSSVELVGDLLFNLTGIKANVDPTDEDDETLKEAGASLKEALGEDKRNKILSALYVCRCDTAGAVRSAAIGVWKVLVHSPRILKELVPTLTQLLIRRLGSSNMEHKVIASNALGELIRKAGDGVLASLLPTLEEGLVTSTDSDAKQGICLALKELIASATAESLEDHEKTLISVVRTALTDSDEDVREAAAEAFDALQDVLGKRAVDQVLPFFLNLLRSDDEAQNALAALLTLLTETTRSNIILPSLIPTLTTPPISAFDAKALASLSRVAGAAMNRRLPNIINSLMDNEINCENDELRGELEQSFDTVIQSIDEYDGLSTVMSVLLGLLKHEDHRIRAATARHMCNFFTDANVDYSRYNQDIIRNLLNSFDDGDDEVVKAAWAALSEFTKKLKKEEMESLVPSTRQSLQRVGVSGANLRGFDLPKGINAILPIFLQGLINGTADQRVHAAAGISDIVDRTSEASLKPFVTQITGPLIRVVSDRSTDVKIAIILTLNNLLEKIPALLKPFLPQLQRTFARSLADPSSNVLRTRAATALGTLIKYTPRVDPLIAELVTGSRTSDSGVKTAMLKALYEVISKAGSNMGEASRTAVLSLIDAETDERDENMTVTHAKLLGALIKNVPEEVATGLLKARVFTNPMTVSSSISLNAVLVESPEALTETAFYDDLPELLCTGMKNINVSKFCASLPASTNPSIQLQISSNSIVATGKLLLSAAPKNFDAIKSIVSVLADIIQPGQPIDPRRLSLVVIRTVSRANTDIIRPHVPLLAQPIFASVRDSVIPVKLAAEAAFVELFSVVDEEAKVFDKFMSGPGSDLSPNIKRSMTDYFKRVAMRLGAQARERREAEGGQGGLGLSNDEAEDEREIWTVGKAHGSGETFD